jgi:hypothetical protein
MGVDHLKAESLNIPGCLEIGASKKSGKPLTVKRARREAAKAGLHDVVGVTFAADGSVSSLTFGGTAKAPGNELDEWKAKHANSAKGH